MNTTTHSRYRRGDSRSRQGPRKTYSKPRTSFRGNFRSNKRGGHKNRGTRKMSFFDPSKFINTNPVEVTEEVYAPRYSFKDFGLSEKLEKAIASMGITTPSPIQDQIIPEITEGKDVIGLAETGTGKTAAFLIPLIEKTLANPKRQTLILAPTRELAIQIEEEFRKLSSELQLYSVVCVGGVSIRPQMRALRRTNHFIIGTPGRILDLIKRKSFHPGNITTVVLDEADRMLDMGFIHDMKHILKTIPQRRETLLFSATMSKGTKELSREFLRDPITISVKKKDVTDSILQDVVHYRQNGKIEKLLKLLKEKEYTRVIIFGAMKHSVEKLARELSRQGVRAESIHGNKNHGQRQRALQKFKNGNARVLVATDVAARGIHVDKVSHVINYDLPATFEDYVHRIGRTGRGNNKGKALTFVAKQKNITKTVSKGC